MNQTSLVRFLKRTLSVSSPNSSSNLVIFVALLHPFSHYDRILRKLGCNLAVHRDSKRFIFFDMLSLKCPGLDGDGDHFCKGGLVKLYAKIQKSLEVLTLDQDIQRHITVIIDDFSLIKVATNGSSNHCTDFLHYFRTLTSEFYIADVVIKVEPLATGLADVHGQLTVVSKEQVRDKGPQRATRITSTSD